MRNHTKHSYKGTMDKFDRTWLYVSWFSYPWSDIWIMTLIGRQLLPIICLKVLNKKKSENIDKNKNKTITSDHLFLCCFVILLEIFPPSNNVKCPHSSNFCFVVKIYNYAFVCISFAFIIINFIVLCSVLCVLAVNN